jgi:hypothetical protein
MYFFYAEHHAMKTLRGAKAYFDASLTSELDERKWLDSRFGLFDPTEKKTKVPTGFKAGMGAVEKRTRLTLTAIQLLFPSCNLITTLTAVPEIPEQLHSDKGSLALYRVSIKSFILYEKQ